MVGRVEEIWKNGVISQKVSRKVQIDSTIQKIEKNA